MNVTNRHYTLNDTYIGVYWPIENSFTILEGSKLASSGTYYQVSPKEVLGKFDNAWWTGHILYTAGM